jgi:hypothetical protein
LIRKITISIIKENDKIRLVCVCKCNHIFVYDIFNNAVICSDDTVQRQCATNGRSQDQSPNVSLLFFTDIILPAALWPGL